LATTSMLPKPGRREDPSDTFSALGLPDRGAGEAFPSWLSEQRYANRRPVPGTSRHTGAPPHFSLAVSAGPGRSWMCEPTPKAAPSTQAVCPWFPTTWLTTFRGARLDDESKRVAVSEFAAATVAGPEGGQSR
jgi:hypothetical protein